MPTGDNMATKGQYIYEWPRPMVTVDVIVFCQADSSTKVLLIKRGKEPHKGQWAFPGGFLELDEELVDGAKRELLEETGLKIAKLEQFHSFGDIGRDPRGRLITVSFMGFVDSELPVKGSDDAEEAGWFDINDLPQKMAFDHNLVAEKAIETLKGMQTKKDDGLSKIDSLDWAYRTSTVLQMANRVGIFDVLSEKPLSAEQISSKCKTDTELTEKLLIACAALGLLIKDHDEYRNSDIASTYLVKGQKLYQGNMISHSAWVRTRWDEIEESICDKAEYSEAEQHYNFIMAMDNIANASRADLFLKSIDLSGRKLLLDVGGGPGSYSIAACKKYPQLKAVVFDLKETIDIAKKVIAREGMAKQVDTIEGSWEMESYGSGYDVVILSNILHGKESEAAMKLKKSYTALEPGGLLAVQEFLLDDNKDGPLTAALFNMMVGAFSKSELIEVISQAGFINAKVVSMKNDIGSGWVSALKPRA